MSGGFFRMVVAHMRESVPGHQRRVHDARVSEITRLRFEKLLLTDKYENQREQINRRIAELQDELSS